MQTTMNSRPTAVQMQTAVTAYLESKLLLQFAFVLHDDSPYTEDVRMITPPEPPFSVLIMSIAA